MRIYTDIDRDTWKNICQRVNNDSEVIQESVSEILQEIRNMGDAAIFRLTEKIEGYSVDRSSILVHEQEILEASEKLSSDFKAAIEVARMNIELFHRAQQHDDIHVTTMAGVELIQRAVPISKVGIYIPNGSAPLFSTILMCALPAQIAGCKEIILSTPANKNGDIAPEILYVAKVCGIKKIYKMGGAIAIGALAYGSESITPVNKIFGPGNRYVTYAKQLVATHTTSIDMPAGPSEVMIVGDSTADPSYIAADLLSQLEHGADSQAIALVTSEALAADVVKQVKLQLTNLERQSILQESLVNCHIIVEKNRDKILELVNDYAAEHLIVAMKNADDFAFKVESAGSIFIGNYSPESVGDYASGTNHTLPTSGWAKSCSGVNLNAFFKQITYQKLSKAGLANIAPSVMLMAEHEGLTAHKNAVKIRLTQENVNNGN